MSPTRHFPATTLLCIQAMRLRTESISMIVCSATATEFAPPLLATGTPAWRAASMSSRSYPALTSWISLSLGAAL